MSYDDEAFLAHYGVKGMRWGKRKAVTPSEDHETSRAIKSKKLSEMSNAELKQLTTRMDLEQKYKKLNPKKISKGKAAIASAVGTAGLAFSIYNMANHPLTKKLVEKGTEAMFKGKAAAGITKAITG